MYHVLNIVLLLPPAPAALVLDGRAFATLSALSAAAFLLIAVAGPPGGFGDDGLAVVEPVEGGELTGEEGRGEDCEGWSARASSISYLHASHVFQNMSITLLPGRSMRGGREAIGRVHVVALPFSIELCRWMSQQRCIRARMSNDCAVFLWVSRSMRCSKCIAGFCSNGSNGSSQELLDTIPLELWNRDSGNGPRSPTEPQAWHMGST